MSKVDGNDSKNTLYCSFCGKSQHEVRKLIAGPTVFVCDECVELCMDIIGEENKSSLTKSRDGIPTPKEIRKVLDDYGGGKRYSRQSSSCRFDARSEAAIPNSRQRELCRWDDCCHDRGSSVCSKEIGIDRGFEAVRIARPLT